MSKPEEKATEKSQEAATANLILAEFVGAFQALRESVAAPAFKPVAPPPKSDTTPGGKFLVNGRWVFSDGSPWGDDVPPPLHQGAGIPGASSLAPPGNFAPQLRPGAASQPLPNPNAAIPGTSV